MILSDRSIKEYLENGWIKIVPVSAEDIQPASVDLHLSDDLKKITGESVSAGDGYVLKPDEFILGSTSEWVELNDEVVGLVDGKSSIGRCGVMVHITAGYIDPAFRGNITLEIKNVSGEDFVLRGGMSICQIVFQPLSSKCERGYGSVGLGSKYQGSKGTVLSRLNK